MKLNQLSKIKKAGKKRLGQGHGSGRGKTAGRGTKGQKARGTISLSFEGGAVTLIKRLPFRRGKGRNKVFKKKPIIINVKALNLLPKGSVINVETLVKYSIVDRQDSKTYGVKVLGEGEVNVPLTLAVPASKGAKSKIVKAGGKVTQNNI